MKKLEYDVAGEGYINRFITTGVFTKPQKFQKAVLKGRVNEWLKKGFSIHENPCRKEFVAKRRGELPDYMDPGGMLPGTENEVWGQRRKTEVYFPFGNIGYEDSGFYSCPTYLRTWCFVILEASEDEDARFEAETCGGLTVWNNGELLADFIPFTRNMVKRTEIEIPLKKGGNRLVLCLDDLAERDTDYYFRLRYTGTRRMKMILPVPDGTDTGEIKRYETILDQIFFEKEAYVSEPVVLALPPHLIREGDAMSCAFPDGETAGKTPEGGCPGSGGSYRLRTYQRRAELFHAEDHLPGYYEFLFGFASGPVRICRKMGTQLVWKRFLAPGPEEISERKEILLRTLSRYGADNIYKAAAYLALDTDRRSAERILRGELRKVNERQDCSDFCFTMILFLYIRYGDRLSEETRRMIEEAAAGWRYWIDEPGDDVMWFFSENHALLFHLCQYLAGRTFPDLLFRNSGRTGREAEEHGRELLEEWFDSFFREFITEWNSNAYIPIDVLGLATLYNLTDPEEPLHGMAEKALDMTAFSIAVNAHKGAVMTSFGRTYEKELKGNYSAGTTSLLYLFYNAGFLTGNAVGSTAAALGDYEPPAEYRRYISPEPGTALNFENTQGFEQHVNLCLYKDSEVLLSTAVMYNPFRRGYQEHIVQAVIDETAQVFINHPGEIHPYGSGRPNYWAGNGSLPLAVQYRNLAVVVFRIPEEDRIDFTHAYVPLNEFQEYEGEENAIALKKDGGYIGVKAMNGLEMVRTGPCTYREFRSPGRRNVWLLKVKNERETADRTDFLEEMKAMRISEDDAGVTVTDGENELRIGYDMSFRVNGTEVLRYPLDAEGIIAIERETDIESGQKAV